MAIQSSPMSVLNCHVPPCPNPPRKLGCPLAPPPCTLPSSSQNMTLTFYFKQKTKINRTHDGFQNVTLTMTAFHTYDLFLGRDLHINPITYYVMNQWHPNKTNRSEQERQHVIFTEWHQRTGSGRLLPVRRDAASGVAAFDTSQWMKPIE
jgi:hypothetical protein